MARFLFIGCATLSLLGALAARAQTRPVFPPPRPTPAANAAPRIAQPPQPSTLPPASNPAQPALPATRPAEVPTGPPVPPVVSYRDGMLTVQALNSTLSSVLSAIRNKTGIEFEGAENIPERVAISMGPAPEGDVLSAILAGSRYDYLAIGRADNPAIVQRVILTMKGKPGAPAEAQAQPRPNAQQGDEEETPDESVNAGGDTEQVQPSPVPQQQPPPEAQATPQAKTPEQLLQELQEMRRQKNSPEGDANTPQAPQKPPQH
ncbi:MAG TPA: hypothetical protein VGJ33_14460 [Candidatus Angelobacter sp.]